MTFSKDSSVLLGVCVESVVKFELLEGVCVVAVVELAPGVGVLVDVVNFVVRVAGDVDVDRLKVEFIELDEFRDVIVSGLAVVFIAVAGSNVDTVVVKSVASCEVVVCGEVEVFGVVEVCGVVVVCGEVDLCEVAVDVVELLA